MVNILVADADPGTGAALTGGLHAERYHVLAASAGPEALDLAETAHPDLVLLDTDLTGIDGFEVCRRLQRKPDTASIPVLFVSSRSDEIDRVLALELGAADYITKPFSARELLLRVKKQLDRRAGPRPSRGRLEHVMIGELEMDLPRHEVTVAGHAVNLTVTEFDLLFVLIANADRVMSRTGLLQTVWRMSPVDESRAVDTHMRRLRKKLGTAARYLYTVRGVGYRFVAD